MLISSSAKSWLLKKPSHLEMRPQLKPFFPYFFFFFFLIGCTFFICIATTGNVASVARYSPGCPGLSDGHLSVCHTAAVAVFSLPVGFLSVAFRFRVAGCPVPTFSVSFSSGVTPFSSGFPSTMRHTVLTSIRLVCTVCVSCPCQASSTSS